MSQRKIPLIALVLVCALAITAGLGVSVWHASRQPSGPAPAFMLTDLSGKQRPSSEWQGKLLLVNFWATWCGPCLDEIPELIKAQQKYAARGLQIIGPAVDDADSVRKMQGKLGMSYPILIGTPDELLTLMTQLGNTAGGLPFTVLADGDGHVIATQLGQFNAGELDPFIEKHLQ